MGCPLSWLEFASETPRRTCCRSVRLRKEEEMWETKRQLLGSGRRDGNALRLWLADGLNLAEDVRGRGPLFSGFRK